jgi:hypothetical protein
MADDLAPAPITAPHPDVPIPPDAQRTLAEVCEQFRSAEVDVAVLESELAEAKAYRDYLARVTVPEALHHAQASSYTCLNNGAVVTVEHRLHCSIAAPMKQAVLAWIKGLGKSDLLTCTMSVAFARNEYAKARAFARAASTCLGAEQPVHVVEEWNIHAQTLKAFIGAMFFKTGRLAEIHEGVRYFNENVAVVRLPDAPPMEENPLA